MAGSGTQLGIDFGTSNTVAVVRLPDGRSRSLLFDGSPLLPSAVYVEPSGTLVVGRDAIHSARLEPARFEPNPKRRIDDSVVLLGDRELPVTQVVAAVLTRVHDEFRRTVGDGVPNVTITCPAAWGATRRLVLSDAATAAGLGQIRLVPEPVAAATYFTQVLGRAVPIGSVVVVHDFGAGTFDASVVARTATGFEVLAVDGRDDIGGLDVDQAVIGHVQRICEERDADAWRRLATPSTVDERRARRLLWDDVRVAKERLSRQAAADLTVPLLNIDLHLTRPELEELARPILDQTVRVTQGVIRWARLPEGRLAGVFLVGGSSRMPLVATLLHKALGEPPVVIDSPELVVAEGSLLARSASLPSAQGPAPGPQTASMPRILPSAAPTSPPGGNQYPPPSGPGGNQYPLPSGPGGQLAPTSAPPVSGPPVSGPPVSVPPVSGPPVSAPPVSPGVVYSTGRAQIGPASAPTPAPTDQPRSPHQIASTRPMPRTEEYAQPPRQADQQGQAYRRAVPASPVYPPGGQAQARRQIPPEPAYREPAYRQSEYRQTTHEGGSSGGGGSSGVLRTVLVTILLIAVPFVSAYIAYQITIDEPLWPPSMPW